ncbi:uncharacterized protein EV420DRAFT_739545 [Desarmillaria tabescens]|uniref:RRM domain-containing protein n=1 Tax=Armillaria tabescens TaxID=1929756 RepID=A0AA39JZC5_ARMTA|nr:uncharacterized protein EV420DRAFT_739545 [Desarmillaria tabescens]KAK0450551.1 hypothetical protein EV420DRAFT_739545 [Desarmillaria tabescens]
MRVNTQPFLASDREPERVYGVGTKILSPSNMFRASLALRRLQISRVPSASYATTAELPSLHRTVRIDNLPESYDVSSIVDTIKANPAESIIPSKDHLLVRFFDEGTAKRCVEANKKQKNLSLKIDDSTSPPVTPETVAMLAKYNATRSIELRDVPESFTDSQFVEILSKYDGALCTHFDRSGRLIEAQFLDIHHAYKAHVDFVEAGVRPVFMDSDNSIYPEWYSNQDTQPNLKRRVKISGMDNPQIRKLCIGWTNNYNKVPSASYITSRIGGKDELLLYFPTSSLARKFIREFEPLVKGRCRLSLEATEQPVACGVVTALSLGARRLVSVPFTEDLLDAKRKKLASFFFRFGRIDSKNLAVSEGCLMVPFTNVVGATSFVHGMYQGLRDRPPAELEGVRPTFFGANHLA